jgi:hypothetical protein
MTTVICSVDTLLAADALSLSRLDYWVDMLAFAISNQPMFSHMSQNISMVRTTKFAALAFPYKVCLISYLNEALVMDILST